MIQFVLLPVSISMCWPGSLHSWVYWWTADIPYPITDPQPLVSACLTASLVCGSWPLFWQITKAVICGCCADLLISLLWIFLLCELVDFQQWRQIFTEAAWIEQHHSCQSSYIFILYSEFVLYSFLTGLVSCTIWCYIFILHTESNLNSLVFFTREVKYQLTNSLSLLFVLLS